MNFLSNTWDLLNQSYSQQSVLNYNLQQQNGPSTTSESFQKLVMNELQDNPADTIQMAQENDLNSLMQS